MIWATDFTPAPIPTAQAIQQQGGEAYVQLQAVNKWNGVMPTYVTAGQALPFIGVK